MSGRVVLTIRSWWTPSAVAFIAFPEGLAWRNRRTGSPGADLPARLCGGGGGGRAQGERPARTWASWPWPPSSADGAAARPSSPPTPLPPHPWWYRDARPTWALLRSGDEQRQRQRVSQASRGSRWPGRCRRPARRAWALPPERRRGLHGHHRASSSTRAAW